MMAGKQNSVWILTLKGSCRHWLEQLGIGKAEEELNITQRTLRSVAKHQNFDSSDIGRPLWALGAFVFVTVEHASEIQAAISENKIDLKAHHLLVSDKYRGLVEELLKKPVGDTVKDKYQSSRKGIVKHVDPVPAKTFSHSESMAVMGPVSYNIAEVPLIIRRTFVEYAESGSGDSRQTRSSGDRPLKVTPPSKSPYLEEDCLPPRDADYGVSRKKFKLRGMRNDAEEKSLNDESLSDAGASTESVRTQDRDDLEDCPNASAADLALLQQLGEKYAEHFEKLDMELWGFRYLGDPESEQIKEISEYLLERSQICIQIFSEFLESCEFSPALAAASSALEAPDERETSIKILLRELSNKAGNFLSTIQPYLACHALFEDGVYAEYGFGYELELRMISLLKQLRGISGSSVLAEAERNPDGLEVDMLKNHAKEHVGAVFSASLSVERLREILGRLERKKQPTPWKLSVSMEDISEEEEDWSELSPQEKYERKKEQQKQRAMRKLMRHETRTRNAPNKRGVPGAAPRRGKHVA